MIQWGRDYLLSHGYTLKNDAPEDIQITPWSHVVRFSTSKGYIYLKQTPPLLPLEPKIIKILHDQFHSAVPEVIATNIDLNCFLMKDAGRPLRETLKKNFDVNLLCKAIDQYTSMQIAVADHVNVFLDIGVPDWRLDKLPHLYRQLLAQKDLLLMDGLLDWELKELEALYEKVVHLCNGLSSYSVRQTIDSNEFQDNNTLMDEKTQKLTISDLGEAVISHPFFSLIGCLRLAKFHYSLDEQSDAYMILIDACLQNYMTVESKKHLQDAFELAKILEFIYRALAVYRLMIVCEQSGRMPLKQRGKLTGTLKEFMTACTASW